MPVFNAHNANRGISFKETVYPVLSGTNYNFNTASTLNVGDILKVVFSAGYTSGYTLSVNNGDQLPVIGVNGVAVPDISMAFPLLITVGVGGWVLQYETSVGSSAPTFEVFSAGEQLPVNTSSRWDSYSNQYIIAEAGFTPTTDRYLELFKTTLIGGTEKSMRINAIVNTGGVTISDNYSASLTKARLTIVRQNVETATYNISSSSDNQGNSTNRRVAIRSQMNTCRFLDNIAAGEIIEVKIDFKGAGTSNYGGTVESSYGTYCGISYNVLVTRFP